MPLRIAIDMSLTGRQGLGGPSGLNPSTLSLTGWYDSSDKSSMFQDSAGTVPVTASGQPVGLRLDKSGNGLHLSQNTTAAKPTYMEGGGLAWLQYDGIDDGMLNVAFAMTQDASMVMGLRYDTGGVGRQFMIDGATSRMLMGVLSGNFELFAETAEVPYTTYAVDTNYVCGAYFNGATSYMRKNGVSTGTAGNPGTAALSTLRVGGAISAWPVLGRDYGLMLRDAPFTNGEWAQIETYLGAKMGLTL